MKYSEKLVNKEKETIDGLKLSIKLKESVDTPKTSDNILIYVILFVISLIIFIVAIILLKKHKKISVLIITILLILPNVVHALKEVTVEITFKIEH